jgi:hypothetical protein
MKKRPPSGGRFVGTKINRPVISPRSILVMPEVMKHFHFCGLDFANGIWFFAPLRDSHTDGNQLWQYF